MCSFEATRWRAPCCLTARAHTCTYMQVQALIAAASIHDSKNKESTDKRHSRAASPNVRASSPVRGAVNPSAGGVGEGMRPVSPFIGSFGAGQGAVWRPMTPHLLPKRPDVPSTREASRQNVDAREQTDQKKPRGATPDEAAMPRAVLAVVAGLERTKVSLCACTGMCVCAFMNVHHTSNTALNCRLHYDVYVYKS